MPKNLETAPTLIPVMTAPLSSAVGSAAKELPRKQAKSSRFPSIVGEVGGRLFNIELGRSLYIEARCDLAI